MDTDVSDDPSVHRLEASAPISGGLVIKNKSAAAAATFKVPKPSLLGLDRLAAQKRKEREDATRLISFKDSEYDDAGGTPSRNKAADGTPIRTPDESSVHKLNRQYREPQEETPTHSGGVSDKARHRLAERIEKDRRGIAYSSKDKKRNRRDYDDDDSGNRRDRKDRHGDRERDRYSERSDRRHRSRSDSERSLHTPRGRNEPRTPRIETSTASWDDDDDRPSSSKQRSSWDFPTPRRDEKSRPDWSTRSNASKYKSSKYVDDTPRPTPAHKYNAWANDRKRSGATPQLGKYLMSYSIYH